MVYSDIKKQIKDGKLDHFYIFSGEEIEVQQAYISHIAQANNQIVSRVDTVAETLKFKGLSLLNQSVCYVCRDDQVFQKAESVWDTIESKIGENTLIYLVTKLDKRSKFYTHWADRIVNFEHMTDQVLTAHIREHLNLSGENCAELIRVCNRDYGQILMEIDKVKSFIPTYAAEHPGMPSYDDRCFEILLMDGTIFTPPTDAIFDWVDAILAGKMRVSFRLLEECQALNEPALRLLLVLYQGIKRLLQVQSCDSKDVANTTGLSQWEINLVRNHIGVYSTIELVTALRNIKSLETAIKTGQIEEEFAVPFAMVSILRE